MSDPRLLWWVDRSTGLMAMLLLTFVVALGILAVGRPGTAVTRRTHAQALHRHLALLASLLLVVHITTAVVDEFVTLDWVDVVVPFGASFEPGWIGLGALAFDLMLVLVLTSLARRRLPDRLWRTVHLGAYALWPLAMTHGLGLGTDVDTRVVPLAATVCAGIVGLSCLWRVGLLLHGPRTS
jgi:sulfoxide reductase heme-binding subunit YedZ